MLLSKQKKNNRNGMRGLPCRQCEKVPLKEEVFVAGKLDRKEDRGKTGGVIGLGEIKRTSDAVYNEWGYRRRIGGARGECKQEGWRRGKARALRDRRTICFASNGICRAKGKNGRRKEKIPWVARTSTM